MSRKNPRSGKPIKIDRGNPHKGKPVKIDRENPYLSRTSDNYGELHIKNNDSGIRLSVEYASEEDIINGDHILWEGDLKIGDKFLVFNQNDVMKNGIYVLTNVLDRKVKKIESSFSHCRNVWIEHGIYENQGFLCKTIISEENMHTEWLRFDSSGELDVSRGGTGNSYFEDGILAIKNNKFYTTGIEEYQIENPVKYSPTVLQIVSRKMIVDNEIYLNIGYLFWHDMFPKTGNLVIWGDKVDLMVTNSNQDFYQEEDHYGYILTPRKKQLEILIKKINDDAVIFNICVILE